MKSENVIVIRQIELDEELFAELLDTVFQEQLNGKEPKEVIEDIIALGLEVYNESPAMFDICLPWIEAIREN